MFKKKYKSPEEGIEIDKEPKKSRFNFGFKKSEWFFLRSEEMILCEIYIPTEICYTFMSKIGENELLELLDNNPGLLPFQRKYTYQISACEYLESRINNLTKVVKEHKISIPPHYDSPPVPLESELAELMNPNRSEFALLRKLANEVEEVNESTQQLLENLLANKEFRQILIRIIKLYYMATGKRHPLFDIKREEDDDEEGFLSRDVGIKVYGGIIQRDKMISMETTLFRCCHGNYILQVDELTEPITKPDDIARKCVFIIFFQGTKTERKVLAIAKAFKAHMYHADESKIRCEQLLENCNEYIHTTEQILSKTLHHLKMVLRTASTNICRWYIQIMKMKAVFRALNLINMEATEKVLVAKCWVPQRNLNKIYNILALTMEENKCLGKPIINMLNEDLNPPTCMILNKFTKAYQNIIDAYGVASYQELNPMPYTVITFPFLFGIMFGDFGHGLIMTLFAIFICVKEKSLMKKDIQNEMWTIIFNGRYIILLMGIASMYTGSIYNDVLSLGCKFFRSAWTVNYNLSTVAENELLQLNPTTDFSGDAYPYGIDPVWMLAENNIDFLNSLKMKLSIIIGIIQMYFGIMLSLVNHLYFHNNLSIIGEFIPQLLFFSSLFGYLVFLCFYKWYFYGPKNEMQYGPGCAPSILITFINMILQKNDETPSGCNDEMFANQKLLQKLFSLIALITIPWMLLVKPLVLIWQYKKQAKIEHPLLSEAELEINYVKKFQLYLMEYLQIEKHPAISAEEEGEEGVFSIFIHQCIHTIEFVLGSVSYTASYLRLWALSLAHEQLSHVLWERVFLSGFMPGLGDFSFIICFIVFNIWAFLTVAILVIMEGLSAFLHALRLHWMEFQSKFYAGSGYPYSPFTFKMIDKFS